MSDQYIDVLLTLMKGKILETQGNVQVQIDTSVWQFARISMKFCFLVGAKYESIHFRILPFFLSQIDNEV